LGGIVKWNVGVKDDGSDSYAEQVVDKNHWPELIDIVCINSEKRKKVSSSEGHKLTMSTSPLYKARPAFAEQLVEKIINQIKEKDFGPMAEIIMRESNNMHATMLDTWPPIIYMNDISINIILKIHELNAAEGENIAAYTHDAGPNTQVLTTDKNRTRVMNALKEVEGINNFIEAKQGTGPRLLDENESLITSELTPKM
jgi:diphosphomevalonate decarboxylase